MIKYLGSKRSLVGWIIGAVEVIHAHAPVHSIVDLFSGSARVAHAFKARGYFVQANDYAAYAYMLARALPEKRSTIE